MFTSITAHVTKINEEIKNQEPISKKIKHNMH